MTDDLKSKLISELVWLVSIVAVSALVEYAVIMIFDLHPILSVKIQALIGLVVIAYGIRMISRMGEEGMIPLIEDDEQVKKDNEPHSQRD